MSEDVVFSVSELLEELKSPDPEQREGAAMVLGSMALSGELVDAPDQATRTLRPLIACLADSHAPVRAQAAGSIGKIVHEVGLDADEEEVLAILCAHFRADLDCEVRCAIVDGLARLGGMPDVMPLLVELLANGEAPLREAIAQAFAEGYTGDADLAAPLRTALADDSIAVRVSAALALWERDLATGRELVPIVVEALGHSDRHQRCAAMRVLVKVGEAARPVVSAIAALVNDPYNLVRVRVADAMVSTQCDESIALSVLRQLQVDPDSLVQTFAQGAIERRSASTAN